MPNRFVAMTACPACLARTANTKYIQRRMHIVLGHCFRLPLPKGWPVKGRPFKELGIQRAGHSKGSHTRPFSDGHCAIQPRGTEMRLLIPKSDKERNARARKSMHHQAGAFGRAATSSSAQPSPSWAGSSRKHPRAVSSGLFRSRNPPPGLQRDAGELGWWRLRACA